MSFQKWIWNSDIPEKGTTNFPCPYCNNGKLIVQETTFQCAESPKRHPSEFGEEFDFMLAVEFQFSCMLQCSICRQSVSCCGNGGYHPEESLDDNGNPQLEWQRFYVPLFFSPNLRIFEVPPRTPKAAANQLNCAFNVFFCDQGASVNHIRSAVEEILSDQDIPRQNENGSRDTLDKRITEFGKKDSNNAELAKALKWIWNEGAHGEHINKEQAIDAFEIVELFLEELYVGRRKSILDRVKKINAVKGFPN